MPLWRLGFRWLTGDIVAEGKAVMTEPRFRASMRQRRRAILQGLRSSCSGVTAIEYGLIAGAIALALIAAGFAIGGDLKSFFESASTAVKGF